MSAWGQALIQNMILPDFFFLQKNADCRVTYDPTVTHPGQLTCCFSLGKGSLDHSSLGAIQLMNYR